MKGSAVSKMVDEYMDEIDHDEIVNKYGDVELFAKILFDFVDWVDKKTEISNAPED